MTRLEESLRELAAEAPPPENMAQRALSVARRRRRRTAIPAMAAAVVGVVAVVGLVTSGLPTALEKPGGDPATTVDERPQTVRFPTTAPALPATGVGPARLTYTYQNKWRVLLADGRHFVVEQAVRPKRQGDTYGGHLTVSPDGRRIAYFQTDGTFVVRDLASGSVGEAFRWDRRVFQVGTQESAWSPDGRWLLVTPGPAWEGPGGGPSGDCVELDEGGCRPQPTNEYADPALLDTGSMKVVELPDTYNQIFGMSNGDALFPHVLGWAETYRLPLFDHHGRERGEVPTDLLPGKENDGVLGNISPDGRTLAAITFGPLDSDQGGSKLLDIDLDSGRLAHQWELGDDWRWEGPSFEGWIEDDKVLVMTNHLQPGAGDDAVARRLSTNVHAVDLDTGRKTHYLRILGKEGYVRAIAYRAL